MENKNFEKAEIEKLAEKEVRDFYGEFEDFHDEYEFFIKGYNTCLDRTNAKGIYEAAKKLTDFCLDQSYSTLEEYLVTLDSLTNELQTELKKAEDN